MTPSRKKNTSWPLLLRLQLLVLGLCCALFLSSLTTSYVMLSHSPSDTALMPFLPDAVQHQAADVPVRLPRVLAILFPQFHQDPLNDKLWGTGFTDWNNLRKAPLKNRLGYEIPRPTTELGWYDLTTTATRKRQGELAREYGIDGFVFHHYWFYDPSHPGPTLHRPLEEMLKDGAPDLPFCLNWCATKWMDTWHGSSRMTNTTTKSRGSQELQHQFYPDNENGPEVQEHYNWLRQFFHHRNYIKVKGQPVLFLYEKKPGAFRVLKRMRELAIADGFPGLYMAVGMSKTHDDLFPQGKDIGQKFNRFPIANVVNKTLSYPQPYNITSHQVYYVPSWCQRNNKRSTRGSQLTGLLIAFDNTPRRSLEAATLWSADDPDKVVARFYDSLYASVYYETCCFTDATTETDDDRLILINSWNEWAEGMALEPSNVFGRRFLETVRQVKKDVVQSRCQYPQE